LGVFGPQRAHWAVALTGFVIGIAMFYNAGFVILAPLVFSIAAASGQNLVSLAIAMAAPLSVTHGFLPPHPGATNIANLLGADLGKTLLLGLIISVPVILIAGILFPKHYLKRMVANPPAGLFDSKSLPDGVQPSFSMSLLVALLPVLLMAVSTLVEMNWPTAVNLLQWTRFLGDPNIAMLLAVLVALFIFAQNTLVHSSNRLKTSELLERSNLALGAASSLLLVIAAGGAFKQVLVDSGIGKSMALQLIDAPVSPLFLAWGLATLLRIALGSATVAGTTAAGMLIPLAHMDGTSPELMTLAIGAGSLMCSHVNDTGFWMFKEWFGLSLRDTFRSWTLMETIVGTLGLIGVLILDLMI
jgi:Gnt-I system high-affinity gluconate transporter/Gnt-II system L-idonate transporter